MFKLIRPFILATSGLILMLLVLNACSSTGATRLPSTPTPTKPTATPVAANPTSTLASTQAMTMETEMTPTTIEMTPVATEVMNTTPETKTTPAAMKVTPVATEVMSTTTETKITPAAVKATPVSTKVTGTTTETKTASAAVKAALTSAKPAVTSEEFMAMTSEDKTLGEILTDKEGMTLYTFKNDKPGESSCDTACTKNWPPVLVEDEDTKLASATGITGSLGVIERKDGTYQVTYNKMPLYYYAEDAKPGDTKGENVRELWHVVSLKAIGG
jgi:predicted lipoprotein with Yx(FWY)xxD motif